MFTKTVFFTSLSLFFFACNAGFEKFAPPQNSITGRGAKVNPKILTSTPSDSSTVSPVTGSTGTQIRVVFDMSMKTDMTPVINTWVRDIGSNNDIIWNSVANSGATFTWSSTTYANDTVTIQLGWVRWPENNIIGFDFDNNTLVNLDDMPLSNENKISFTVGWNPGRYKVVQTGQESCYSYAVGGTPQNWQPRPNCIANVGLGDDPVGSKNFPAGQNGIIEPRNSNYGPTLYGASAGGNGPGRRFLAPENPMNMVPANCVLGNASEACYPYSVDPVTTLVWRTCSQGQYYKNAALSGDKCVPPSASDFTWGQAVNACAVLNTTNNGQGYGGRKDWRLPTVDELENLVDYGARAEVGQPEPALNAPEVPAIDGQKIDDYPYWEGAFPNTPPKGYWTATGLAARLNGQTYYGEAYIVEFKKGSMGAGAGSGSLLESNRKTSNRKKVRCVAGPAVAPAAQTLVPAVVAGSGAIPLVGIGATFSGFDNNATFNVKSATPAYTIETNQHSLAIDFNKLPNTVQAGTTTNYCIAAANATACGVSSPTISTSLPVAGSTTAYKLTLGSAMGSNTAYKVFVTGVQSASDQWLTAQSYSANTYLYDSGNAYRAVNTHTSTSIAADIVATNLEQLAQFTASTAYTANTKLFVPSLNQVVNVQSGYTSGTSASTDITNGLLLVVKNIITTPPQALSLSSGLFNGTPRTAAPAAATVFNVVSATSPNLTSVQVTFNRLPDTTQATTIGNYKIISGLSTVSAVFGSASVVPVTAVSLSGYTATLSAAVAAGTPYAVVTQNITFAGANVVDDTVNKLRWQKCRKGTFDNATCGDDGDGTNDSALWNDALNYCDSLNAIRYDNDSNTSASLRFAWRAPTINELKSIANRSLFGTVGVAIDATVFPTPNIYAEDYASSTNYNFNGQFGYDPLDATPLQYPNYNRAWAFNYIAGFSSVAEKDNSTLIPGLKPPKKSIRCVRGLP